MCECPDCGLFQQLPALRPGNIAACTRCGAVLRKRRHFSFSVTLALMIAGLALFSITLFEPLMGFSFFGQTRETSLPALPLAYKPFGLWMLSIVVFATTLAAPLLKLLLTAGVLIGLRLGVASASLATMARVRHWLTPWSMTEVFLLGMFVAYTRLADIATVQVGIRAVRHGRAHAGDGLRGCLARRACHVGRDRPRPACPHAARHRSADRLRHVRPGQPGAPPA